MISMLDSGLLCEAMKFGSARESSPLDNTVLCDPTRNSGATGPLFVAE